jgi:hypothetical protein
VKDENVSKQTEKATIEHSDVQTPNPLEKDLDIYPVRDPSEDPRWAVRIIWVWVSMALFLLLFLVTLFIVGFWYD